MSRDKKSSDNGILFCPKYPHLATEKKEDLNYHIAKHDSSKDTKLSTMSMCTVCLEEFLSLYSLQQNKRRKHGSWYKFE